ncbi:MAG TPA: hypothetical protein VH482_30460 [Thermomicrobiales bacterium]|jgi:hypothetical protein
MSYDPEIHHRRSIRLAGYDYAQPGAYFVTLCVQDRLCILGEIAEGEMHPNTAGLVIASWWEDIPRRFPGSELDRFVVMPNHLHGIVLINGVDESVVSTTPEGGHRSAPTGLGAFLCRGGPVCPPCCRHERHARARTTLGTNRPMVQNHDHQ